VNRSDDRARALSLLALSRETEQQLDVLVSELARWQAAKNLVGAGTLDQVWSRHILDSAQLLHHAPSPGLWLDLGSGGGFPGLVMAILRTEAQLGATHLVESNGRKCAFLKHVIRLTGVDAVVHQARLQDHIALIRHPVAVVSARALAPLGDLLLWCDKLLRTGTLGIFPKGQDVDKEWPDSAISGGYHIHQHASLTDPKGCILTVRHV
jgi:16S rRNA (guanine527-N7)-methyltransferase